jgi:hypothetical protein
VEAERLISTPTPEGSEGTGGAVEEGRVDCRRREEDCFDRRLAADGRREIVPPSLSCLRASSAANPPLVPFAVLLRLGEIELGVGGSTLVGSLDNAKLAGEINR